MLYYLGTQERATKYRGVEQMVARRAHNPEVAGSSPVPATIYELSFMTVLFLSGYEHYKRCSLGRSGAPLPVAD